MKLEEDIAGTQDEKQERMIETSPAKKRKGRGTDKPIHGKRRKLANNIRDYISCKKWRLEGADGESQGKEAQGQEHQPQQGQHHQSQIEVGQAAARTTPPSPTTTSPPPRRAESCIASMHDGMPGPIVQANTGGKVPSEPSCKDNETNDFPLRDRASPASMMKRRGEPDEEKTSQQQHNQQPEQMPTGEQICKPGERGLKEEISCGISMHNRMPGPVVQASQGGTSPNGTTLRSVYNTPNIRQPVLRWPADCKRDEAEEGTEEERDGPTKEERELGHMVKGTDEEERETYLKFLEYCEERRRSWAKQVEEDEDRMRICRRKEDQWTLLRESIQFLKENEKSWQTRRIKEIERIKEEEKAERLTICAEKKKRYGIKKFNNEDRKG